MRSFYRIIKQRATVPIVSAPKIVGRVSWKAENYYGYTLFF